MGDWNPFVLISAFMVVGAALLAAFSWPRRDPRRQDRAIWDAVTQRLGGKLFVRGGDYRVRFKWHGHEAALIEGPEIAFEIRQRLLPGTLAIRIRPGSPEVGLQSVDYEALPGAGVSASDAKAARELLTPAVAKILKDVGSLKSKRTSFLPSVRFEDTFEVRLDIVRDVERLVRMALLSMQLAQHARLFAERDAGIHFEEVKGAAGECQICGAVLEGVLVSCARCATPHHRDCWDYTGRCSTYGCGETKSAGA